MHMQQYIDFGKIHEDYIIAYSRVSSAQQDIQKQITYARAYINNHGIKEEKVIWLNDHNVSANKLKMEERAGLVELRLLIKQKKVKTIIVYSRDRFARNFYEYVVLVKEFYHFGVNIIFTSQMQPPFSKNLSIEALFGIFSQTEGRSISFRRSDTNKQFPSHIFGFKKIGNKKNTQYIINNDVYDELKSFLLSVSKVSNADELFSVFMKYKKMLKGKSYDDLLRYLQNPFYSGYVETLYGYDKMQHVVEPIITLDDFKANQLVLKKLKNDIFIAINNASSHGVIVPYCSICKKTMRFRSSALGENGYYVCKKKHKEIKITVNTYNDLIISHLKTILESMSSKKLKQDVFGYLKSLETETENQVMVLNRYLKNIHKEMTEKYTSISREKLEKLVQKARHVKQEIEDFHFITLKIDEARNGINEYVRIIQNNLSKEILGYDLYYLCNLFYSKIEISDQSLIYHVTFSKYFESEDYHELRT